MRLLQFLIFFGIVLSVHTLVNYYIFIRGLKTFDQGSLLRQLYTYGFWFLAASFFVGRILEKVYLSHMSDFFTWAGSFWLAAMLYLFIAVFLIDLLRFTDRFIPFLDRIIPAVLIAKPYIFTIALAIFTFFLILAGHINATLPKITRIQIPVSKEHTSLADLKVVLVTDVHLGTIISTKRVRKIVDKINALQPDLVLMAGDIVDEDLAPVIRQNLGGILANIDARLGVIGSTGNHEYIGGAEQAVAYLQSHGITMLRDSALAATDLLYIIGREDVESMRFGGNRRKQLDSIMQNIPEKSFTIVLDHQPRAIEEARQNGVHLVLSGHTHHGQLWPLNHITQAMFPLSYGLKRFGETYAYVSNGVGSWGPPVRIGNRPEIVLINFRPSQ